MTDYQLPETLPCPECNQKNCVHQYLSSAPAIGDPVKLGITRPPDAFLHGVLGRMQETVVTGGVARDSRGKIQLDSNGKPKRKFVDFSKARYSPGRLV